MAQGLVLLACPLLPLCYAPPEWKGLVLLGCPVQHISPLM